MKTYIVEAYGSLDCTETIKVQCDILKTDNKHTDVIYADHVRIELCGDIWSIDEEEELLRKIEERRLQRIADRQKEAEEDEDEEARHFFIRSFLEGRNQREVG